MSFRFQSSLPRGERHDQFADKQHMKGFQSTLPRGERHYTWPCTWFAPRCNFNPRSREGSDWCPRQCHHAPAISIRAPARGATLSMPSTWCPGGISIRAPARGATAALRIPDKYAQISIRAPARGATYLDDIALKYLGISIRAPARGATLSTLICCTKAHYFNPRSREGSDFALGFTIIYALKFQSALPRGERRGLQLISLIGCNFNPRSREGSDLIAQTKSRRCSYFNPRSREGSDDISSHGIICLKNFNPRSREGSDQETGNS